MKCAQIKLNVPGCEYQVQVEAPPGGFDALGIRCCCWEFVVLVVEAKNCHGVVCVDGQVAGEGIFVDLRLRVVEFPQPPFA